MRGGPGVGLLRRVKAQAQAHLVLLPRGQRFQQQGVVFSMAMPSPYTLRLRTISPASLQPITRCMGQNRSISRLISSASAEKDKSCHASP